MWAYCIFQILSCPPPPTPISLSSKCPILLHQTLPSFHREGRVLSFFSSRRNWDCPNPSTAAACAPPPPPLRLVPGGGALSLAREGVGESQFRRGNMHCGTLYIYVLCASSPPPVKFQLKTHCSKNPVLLHQTLPLIPSHLSNFKLKLTAQNYLSCSIKLYPSSPPPVQFQLKTHCSKSCSIKLYPLIPSTCPIST